MMVKGRKVQPEKKDTLGTGNYIGKKAEGAFWKDNRKYKVK